MGQRSTPRTLDSLAFGEGVMPFANYQSVADVARPFRIHFRRENFVRPLPAPLSDYFRSELDFTLREVPFDDSESAACETLIYPFLREVWRGDLGAVNLLEHPPHYD